MSNHDTIVQDYIREIQKYDTLSFEDEQALAHRWVDKKDREAFHKLMQSYLRLVVKTAVGFRGYGLPLSEVIQEGNIGLMHAIARFDPTKGFRLSTYAMWWIRASIQEYVLNNWSLVKVGSSGSHKKLFFNLRRLRNQLREVGQEHLSPDAIRAIATQLGVREDEVIDMDQRLTAVDSSLNSFVGDDSTTEWSDMLAEDRPNPEEIYSDQEIMRVRRRSLQGALDKLDDRERAIFIARRLSETEVLPTLEDLSSRMGISRERVRQLEVRAFEKVRKFMHRAA